MNTPRTGRFFSLAALAILLWACSSGPKPVQAPAVSPAKPASESAQPRTAQPQENKIPEARTIIPPEEKKSAVEGANLQEKPVASDKDEAAAVLEEALNVYQEAGQARERGDLDGALNSLDEAYRLILRAKLPPDSSLLQEKSNLRLLIAQRIQEISAIRRNPVNGNHKAIPLVENKYVLFEIEQFKGPERKLLEESYKRSGLYKDWIQGELRKAGLPEEFCWLPVIESWYQVKALSRARALGMWQFIKSTGLRYGLTRDRFVDERMDPFKATTAAIKYLEELHSLFGDWLTALASYNCGEARVQYCINTQSIKYLDDFWELFQRLPFETARYVPRFIATLLVIQNPEKYGFVLPEPYPPLKFETIKVNYPTKLATLSGSLGLEASELIYLNPELLNESTPNKEYELRVPVGSSEKALAAISSLPKYIPPEYATHIVSSGQTLSQIAARYGTSVEYLMRLNGLRGTLIRVGQALKVPGRGTSPAAD